MHQIKNFGFKKRKYNICYDTFHHEIKTMPCMKIKYRTFYVSSSSFYISLLWLCEIGTDNKISVKCIYFDFYPIKTFLEMAYSSENN